MSREVVLKHVISQPYNFQHLTHTHAQQVRELKKAGQNELVSGFSAIRASQAPRSELQGIRAMTLPSRASQPEPKSPPRSSPVTPPPTSPSRLRNHRSSISCTSAGSLQNSRSIDNFSQPSPRAYQSTHRTISPPPRVSSRHFASDLLMSSQIYQTDPCREYQVINDDSPEAIMYSPSLSSMTRTTTTPDDDSSYFSTAPHAVTTPDDTALTLRSFPFGSSGTELADVPEEEENNTRMRNFASGLRHAKSFPSAQLLSNRWSPALSPVSAQVHGALPSDDPPWVEPKAPCIDQPFDDVPVRTKASQRVSVGVKTVDGCWEDDIDYCYEHAAEADCDFEWDRMSMDDEIINELKPLTVRSQPSLEPLNRMYETTCHNKFGTPELQTRSERTDSASHPHLPPLQTLIPDLVYSAVSSAKSPESSVLGALAPLPLSPPGHSVGLPIRSTKGFPLGQSFLHPKDYESQAIQEEIYHNILAGEDVPEHHYPTYDSRFDASSSRDDSPRSSGSPISKCNSQESMMLSRSVSGSRHRHDSDSVGSLPELVHSKTLQEEPGTLVNQPAKQLDIVSVFEASLESQNSLSHQRRRSQSLAADIARQSILQKATNYGSLDWDDSATVILPSLSRRYRAHSDAAARILSVSSLQSTEVPLSRKRSASSATGQSARSSRISYTLFPPTTSHPQN